MPGTDGGMYGDKGKGAMTTSRKGGGRGAQTNTPPKVVVDLREFRSVLPNLLHQVRQGVSTVVDCVVRWNRGPYGGIDTAHPLFDEAPTVGWSTDRTRQKSENFPFTFARLVRRSAQGQDRNSHAFPLRPHELMIAFPFDWVSPEELDTVVFKHQRNMTVRNTDGRIFPQICS